MHLGVFGQVVTAGKLLVAEGAAIWLDPGMGASVARQLVGTREPMGRGGEERMTERSTY